MFFLAVEQVTEKLARTLERLKIKTSNLPIVSLYKITGTTAIPKESLFDIRRMVKEAYTSYKNHILAPELQTLANQLLDGLWPASLKYLVRIEGKHARWFHFNTLKAAKGTML